MRAIRSPSRRIAALFAAVLAGTTIPILTSASPAYADPGCQSGGVYVLWARGSGETIYAGVAQAFHDHLTYALNAAGAGPYAWAELGNLDGSVSAGQQVDDPAHEYPAVPVGWAQITGAYSDSVTIGTNELVTHLNQRYGNGPGDRNCSNETAIIGGYSQGADVVGWALERTGSVGWALSAAAKNHIGFVALYGDPKMDAVSCPATASWWARGNTPCTCYGILGKREPYVRSDFLNRFGSWCDQGDGVCSVYALLPGSHTTVYRDWWIWQSAAEVASKAKTKRCQLAGVGCTVWGGVGNATFLGTNVLNAGSEIGINQYLASPDGRFALHFQTDRNVVLYGGSALWWTGTSGSGATRLAMQTDGNLVLYNGSTWVWQSGTGGSGANRLVVQSDGNLVLYNTNTSPWTPVWWTGVASNEVTTPRGGYLLVLQPHFAEVLLSLVVAGLARRWCRRRHVSHRWMEFGCERWLVRVEGLASVRYVRVIVNVCPM